MRFVAHNGPCTCLALGQKSGRVLVTGGDDKKVNLWAIGKPNILMSLSGHTTTIECVKFGHNEDLVCAGSVAGALKVWDLESVKLVRTLTGHRSAVKCIDFHPYGDFLASGSVDSNIKLWDIRKKGCMYTYKGHVKDVYCLKFSPDGRWLASGGDEGSVKLWDLPAGKLLAELKEHSAPVTDVCFHPNEFLLSSASSDGTIKFWDLETFQQVSTTTNDVGPIRKILYHPEGKTIFSAARDVLKIYGWEPTRTYDTVTMGWGKVNDIAISDNSLVASTFSLTNVSVFIVDLKKLQPFGSSSSSLSSSSFSSSSSNTINTNTTSSPSSSLSLLSPNNSNSSPLSTNTKLMPYRDSVSRQSTRKNFFHGNCSTTHSQLESLESNRSEETETGSDEPEGEESIDINNIYDTKEIFAPSRELNDSSLGYTAKISTSVIPPVTKATTPTSSSSSSIATLPLTKSSSTVLHTSRSMSNLSQKTAKSTNLVHPRQQPEVISIVRPVINDSKTKSHLNGSPSLINTNENHKNSNSMDNNHLHHSTKSVANNINNNNNNNNLHHHHHLNNNSKHQPRAAVVFPTEQQLHKQQPQSLDQIESPVDLIPEARDRPAGLDLDDFLPKHLQDTVRLGYHPQPEMSESEAMQAIIRGHKSVVTALSHRRKNLQIVLAMWSTKDARNALEQAINMEDQSVLVDILNVITLKPASWTLDMCQILVQPIYELLQSRYESYMTVGCSALKLILKNFATIIKTNITAPPGIGVDISREERYHKCMGVYNHLLNVRAFILKRQTLQGKLGRTFRELSILFQNLE
ncbi:katanin p80 WD40 repeat-containing subunit B1-like isoform X3 [Panonychus citri]|uniref:katanin p80 WD40 repeat-containing subunit B1-like isoform X3 n=1 Tax=Panonychus citri TaxID=50023 RepID=UPI002308155F|nr:katanin p80 WD40 repeat-containing subunit B1-like isoform X3 [Panonychus citri]